MQPYFVFSVILEKIISFYIQSNLTLLKGIWSYVLD
jgi:hypothetical protein